MKIAARLSSPHLADALARPATTPAAQPAVTSKHVFDIGVSLDRLGKPAGSWLDSPRTVIDVNGIPELAIRNKDVIEAKGLIERAETLRHSELPSERSEAYDLIRQAAYKLKANHPELAQKFEDAAGAMFINDRGVRTYAILKLYGKTTEEADEATKGLGADPFRGLHQVTPYWQYDQAKAELAKL